MQKQKKICGNMSQLYEIQLVSKNESIEKGIKGYIHQLFTVKEEQYITAIETIAGSKLRNIVVEDENVS